MTWLYLTQRDFERLLSLLRSEDPKAWDEGIGFRRAIIIDCDGLFYSGPCYIRRTEDLTDPSLLWTDKDGQEREVFEAEDWTLKENRKGRKLELGYVGAFDSLTDGDARLPFRTEEGFE